MWSITKETMFCSPEESFKELIAYSHFERFSRKDGQIVFEEDHDERKTDDPDLREVVAFFNRLGKMICRKLNDSDESYSDLNFTTIQYKPQTTADLVTTAVNLFNDLFFDGEIDEAILNKEIRYFYRDLAEKTAVFIDEAPEKYKYLIFDINPQTQDCWICPF